MTLKHTMTALLALGLLAAAPVWADHHEEGETKAAAEEMAAPAVEKLDAPGSLKAGKDLMEAGKYDEAAAYFEGIGEQVAANGLEKREPWRLNNWALSLLKAGKAEEAVKIAEKAVEVAPTNATIWNNLGSAVAATGDREKAVETWEKGIAKLGEAGVDATRLKKNANFIKAALEGRLDENGNIIEKAVEDAKEAVKEGAAKAEEAAGDAMDKAKKAAE